MSNQNPLNPPLKQTLKEEFMTNRIERFEDFIAWQKARKLTAGIYKITCEQNFARDFGPEESN